MIPAINWPRMMEPLCKKFLGYEHVNAVGLNEILIQQKKRPIGGKLYDKLFDTDLDHLEDMNLAHKKGHEVIMMIDSKMFDGKTSYSYADIFNDTHWIVYEGELKFLDSNKKEISSMGKASFLQFKIFTWVKISMLQDF